MISSQLIPSFQPSKTFHHRTLLLFILSMIFVSPELVLAQNGSGNRRAEQGNGEHRQERMHEGRGDQHDDKRHEAEGRPERENRLKLLYETQNKVVKDRLDLSEKQMNELDSKQKDVMNALDAVAAKMREKIDEKRSQMDLRRESMQKIHKDNPEARPAPEVREAMQKAMREKRSALQNESEEHMRSLMLKAETEYLLILHEVLSNKQFRSYIEQREEIRREVRSKMRQ